MSNKIPEKVLALFSGYFFAYIGRMPVTSPIGEVSRLKEKNRHLANARDRAEGEGAYQLPRFFSEGFLVVDNYHLVCYYLSYGIF